MKKVFRHVCPTYTEALRKSGFNTEVTFDIKEQIATAKITKTKQ